MWLVLKKNCPTPNLFLHDLEIKIIFFFTRIYTFLFMQYEDFSLSFCSNTNFLT